MSADPYRKKVWGTTLGVNAKLTLLALGEISEGTAELRSILAKDFAKLRWMMGRSLSNVVNLITRLESQRILVIRATEHGYEFEFHLENEIRDQAKEKREQL